MVRSMEEYSNASSGHGLGQRARHLLWEARERVAIFIGATPEFLIFTSGGTEANNLVLTSFSYVNNRSSRILTTPVEHSSVLKTVAVLEYQGCEIIKIPVDPIGRISLFHLESALSKPTDLVSIQWANNETGVIQPMEAIASICHERGVPLHTDAAQAVGKLPISLQDVPIDFLTFSGHKLHGPQGTGVVFVRNPKMLRPLLFGGEQEHGLRAGTENLPGILGLAKACEIRSAGFDIAIAHMQFLRDRFETKLSECIPGIIANGSGTPRVCNTSNLCFSGIDGQALVAQLDKRGIYCSQSSACTSHRPEPSYVLRAMGLSEDDAYASVRFSFSVLNTQGEVDQAIETIAEVHAQLRAFMEF